MPRQRTQQRKRLDEKNPVDGSLGEHSSAPSPFSLQRMEHEDDRQPLQPIANPKLQLKQAQSHGFNFTNGQGQSGQSNAVQQVQAPPDIDTNAIQTKSIDGQTDSFASQSSATPQSNPSQRLFSRAIQAKKEDALVQRKATFQQGLAYIDAGKHFKPIGEWLLTDFIEINQSMRSIDIKNRTKFEIFAHFAESELSDENTNCLLLLSAIDWGNKNQLYAAAELFSQQIQSSYYQYQNYLPRVQYPTKRPPEEINVSYPLSCKLTAGYVKLHETTAESDKKHKNLPRGQYDDEAINSQVEAQMALCDALMEIGSTAHRLLSMDTMSRFHHESYATLFPKANRLAKVLNMFPGGAKKRRILGGYHEAEDREKNQEE